MKPFMVRSLLLALFLFTGASLFYSPLPPLAAAAQQATPSPTASLVPSPSATRAAAPATGTPAPLEIVEVQPADGATSLPANSIITIFFNRPVVALSAIEDAGNLPNPLILDPPVEGRGEWLDTATFQFTPGSAGLRRATAYTARVARGLTDVLGEAVLTQDVIWRFSTLFPTVTPTPTPIPTPAPPLVVEIAPADSSREISPETRVIVSFNKPMYRQEVEDAFSLVNLAGNNPVAGTFTWTSEPEQFTFTPASPLDPNATYRAVLPSGLKGEYGQEATPQDVVATFTISPDPFVRTVYPSAGAMLDPGELIEINFNTPMRSASLRLGENLLITPTVPLTQIYPYWQQDNTELVINLPLQFSQDYTMTLGADLEGQHGQPLGQPYTLTWRTQAQAALLFIESPGPVATFNAYTDTVVLLTTRNVSRVNFSLYRLPVVDFIRFSREDWQDEWALYRPDPANLLQEWPFEPPLEPNQRRLHPINLGPASGLGQALPPGLYYLEAGVPVNAVAATAGWTSDADNMERQILAVSKYNITLKESGHEALAWLTDLQSGQPVGQQPVTFLHETTDFTAETGSDGVARVSYGRWREPDQYRLAIAGDLENPGDNFALAAGAWNQGINRYNFQNVQTENSEPYYSGHFYTHRALYRPGETVHFKGIIRANDDAHYTVPEGSRRVNVVISDEQGQEVYNEELPLNQMGTANGTLALAAEASLGVYELRASYAGQTFFDNFEVSAYRPPEFALEILTDRARYAQGDTISVTVSANFFFGGPVSNAKVRWTLLSDDFAPSSASLNAYDFVNEEFGDDFVENNHGGFGPQVAEGEGLTSPDGRYTFEVTADIADRLSTQLYTFDVVVSDLNNQEVAGQARVLINKGAFLVGLRPEQFVGRAGQANPVNILVVDWASQPVANQAVDLLFVEYNRYSVQRQDAEQSYYSQRDTYYWETVDEEVPVFTSTVTTGEDGQASVNFSPAKGGIYKLYARATDANNQTMQTSAFTWISGDSYINWGQADNDRFNLVADKKNYKVGETANILVPHAFDGPTVALVTLERGHIYDHFVVDLPNNSTQIQIPITEALLPNIYVSVVVMQGSETAGEGLPSFRMGYVNLPIDPAEKLLQIKLTPDKPAEESYQPRETVNYNVEVTTAQGRPVQTELSLALVDQAVLSLAPEKPGRILQDFWHGRGLAVETASGLTLAIDRFNQAVVKVKGGGGGCVDCGGFEKGFGATRLNLLDTALWVADFITDENGRGTVEATLPDNLTTWTLTGIGVTGDETLVGESTVDIISTKPLLVRPVTPRFFITGDEAQVGVIVQNNTDKNLSIEMKFEAEGMAVGDWRVGQPAEPGPVSSLGGEWQSQGSPTFSLEPGKRLKVEYQVKVEEVSAVSLTMGAKSSDNLHGDALAFELPVYRASTPETVTTAGQLAADGRQSEAIALPDSFDPTQGELAIDIDPSLAAGMQDGLTYLEHFPYECTEQTVSRFLPNTVTYRAYKTLGLPNPELDQKLPDLINLALQRLYQYHHFDGGWGWWADDTSNPYLTAYVLLGLHEADRAGFTVDNDTIIQGIDYLSQNLAAPKDIRTSWEANRQAFMLYVLAEAGRGDLGRTVALFEQRRQLLNLFGQAYLAIALHRLHPEAPQLDILLNDLNNAAITSASGVHWQEIGVDRRAMNTDTQTTAIIIAALTRIRPDHPLLPDAVRWLMNSRGPGGYWRTTQETAWAIMGLTDWMIASGELSGNYAWQVTLNEARLGEGTVAADNIDETTRLQIAVSELLVDTLNRLVIERDRVPGGDPAGQEGSSPGRLYYAAYLTYYKPVTEVTALDRGIRISREYRRVDSNNTINEAVLGDLIEVRLTLEAPNDLHYLLVEDPLPAGAEAINTSLAITSLADQAEAAEPIDDRHYFTHTELRDEKAVLFATYLPRGTYHYTYLIRASLPGRYHVLPAHAEEMYFPEVFGRGAGSLFVIRE